MSISSFSGNGRAAGIAGTDGRVRIVEIASGRVNLLTPDVTLRRLLLIGDGSTVVGSTTDERIRVFDVASGKSRILRGHTGPVAYIASTRDGRWLYSVAADQTLRRWDLQSEESGTVSPLSGTPTKLLLSPDESLLAITYQSGEVELHSRLNQSVKRLLGRSTKPATAERL